MSNKHKKRDGHFGGRGPTGTRGGEAAEAPKPEEAAHDDWDIKPDEGAPEPAPAKPEGDASPERRAEPAAERGLADQLNGLQGEFSTLNDRHLRLAAEFQNYRRRAETEMTEAWGRAQADLVRRFVDVLDDLQRVSAIDPSDDAVKVQTIVDGVDLVERKMARAIQEAGVTVIDPTGQRFDPTTMEAVMMVPAETPEEDDQVALVFQRGYQLRGNLIRPARVSVKKHD